MKIRNAVEQSIKYGLEKGKINPERDSAMIEMIRYMADKLDEDDSDTPMARYITPASFLSYCEKLGIVPNTDTIEKSPRSMVGNSKWKLTKNLGDPTVQ